MALAASASPAWAQPSARRVFQDVAESPATSDRAAEETTLEEAIAARLAERRAGRPGGVELVRVRFEYVAKAPVEEATPALGPDAALGSRSLAARVIVPVPYRGGETIVAHALSYEAVTLDADGVDAREPFVFEHLFGIGYGLVLVQRLGEAWRLTANGGFAIASDFRALSGEDVQGSGGVMVEHRFSEGVSAAIGAAYSSTFSTFLPVPALRLTIDDGNWLRVEVSLPSRASVTFAPHRRILLGARAGLTGSEWHVGGTASDDIRLKLRGLTVGGTAATSFRGWVQLETEVGVALLRSVEVRDAAEETIREVSVGPGYYARTTLSLQL